MDLINIITGTMPDSPQGLLLFVITALFGAEAVVALARLTRPALLAQLTRPGLPPLVEDEAHRFEIGTRARDPETDQSAAIEADLARLITAERWELVHSLIAAWARDGAATPFGTRYARLGVEVALKPLNDLIEAGADGARPAALTPLVDAFTARAAAAPDDPVAAVLAARALMATGWATGWATGSASGSASGPGPAARPHPEAFERADALLAPFPQPTANRPGPGPDATRPGPDATALVAETRYFACLGLPGGAAILRTRFAEWQALDPSDLTPLQLHGAQLLPGWFGSLGEVEAEARRAAETPRPGLGAAGYAVFHGGILDCEGPAACDVIDPELFVRAALDRARASGGQWGANRVADHLMRAMMASRGDDRQVYRDGLIRLVHEHLRVLVEPAWSRPVAEVRHDLARLFKPELARGARVRVGALGVEVLPPAGAAETAAA